jgi:hypothetical protein
MQSFNFNVASSGAVVPVQVAGDKLIYVSGSGSSSAAIIVKPNAGNEITLLPGQGFAVKDEKGNPINVGIWTVKASDGTSTITGTLNIGFGEYFDNSIVSTVTISATDAAALPMRPQALSTAPSSQATVGTTVASVVNNALNKKIIFRNASTGGQTIAIDMVNTVTTANSPFLLNPGDQWIEDECAAKQWYAIASAAGATLNIQERRV